MNIQFTYEFDRREFGLNTPLFVQCQDKMVTFEDFNEPKEHVQLLARFLMNDDDPRDCYSIEEKNVLSYMYQKYEIYKAKIFDKEKKLYLFDEDLQHFYIYLLEVDYYKIPKWLHELCLTQSTFHIAIRYGKLNVVKKMKELGMGFHSNSLLFAVNNIVMFEYIHKNGGTTNEYALQQYIAMEGCIEVLLYAVTNDMVEIINPVSDTHLSIVQNNADVCRYLSSKCDITNTGLCTEAAGRGNLNILIILHENGLLWDEETTHEAARYGHIECLKYLIDNGCPSKWDKLDEYYEYYPAHIVSYLKSINK